MSGAADMPPTPDGRCGDAALYLLGLLGVAPAERFAEHARDCAVCRDELASLRAAVDVLPATVTQLTAPPRVRSRVIGTVRAEARGRKRKSAAWSAKPGQDQSPADQPLQRAPFSRRGALAELRGAPRRTRAALAATALLAGGVALGALAFAGGHGGGGMRTAVADVAPAGARAVLHEGPARGWLALSGMPQPRRGRVYEVWVKRPGGPPRATSSLFAPTRAGEATVAVPSGLPRASEVMVTQEPLGGSASPSGRSVVSARLR